MLQRELVRFLSICAMTVLGVSSNVFATSSNMATIISQSARGRENLPASSFSVTQTKVVPIKSNASKTAANQQPEHYQEIRSLLAAGKSNQAFVKASELSSTEMGKPEFDLLYGKVALAAGKKGHALLAFRRVLMNDSSHNFEAHVGLIYTYHKLNRPKAVYSEVLKFSKLGSLQQRREAMQSFKKDFAEFTSILALPKKVENKFYVRLAFGYDDNVNFATDDDFTQFLALVGFVPPSQYVVNPGQRPFGIDDAAWQNYLNAVNQYNANLVVLTNNLYDQLRSMNNQHIGSYYVEPLLGYSGNYIPGSGKFIWHWNLNAEQKQYFNARGYDIGQVNLSTGVDYFLSKKYALDLAFYYQEYLLDDRDFRETPILELGISRLFGNNNVLKLYTNYGVLSYPGQSIFNVDLYLGGLQWSIFDKSRNNLLITQVRLGEYNSRNDFGKFNGSNFYGFSIGGIHKFTPRFNATLGVLYQNYLYKDRQFINASPRHDNYWKYTAGMNFNINPKLTWSLTGAHTNNKSNIFLYKYDRNEIETSINYYFN